MDMRAHLVITHETQRSISPLLRSVWRKFSSFYTTSGLVGLNLRYEANFLALIPRLTSEKSKMNSEVIHKIFKAVGSTMPVLEAVASLHPISEVRSLFFLYTRSTVLTFETQNVFKVFSVRGRSYRDTEMTLDIKIYTYRVFTISRRSVKNTTRMLQMSFMLW